MKKRILSLLCVLALCLGLLPVTALAEENAPTTLYVGSTTISAGYWTSSDGGTTWAHQENQPEGNNYIYYDGQGTLKLHNATIQGGSNTVSPPYGAGIYALCSSNQPVALTIELIGTNTITGYYGIFLNAEISADSNGTDASLTITSENNGSLQVSGLNYGIYVKSGTGNASLTINDASVVAKTTQTYSSYAGVYVMSSANATGSPNISLSVDGGSLTASASEGNDGIQFYVGSSEATGATTSLTISDNAIVRAENGIKASRVDKPTPSGTGIVFDGEDGTVYGSVTLQDDLTIGAGETLTIGDGASLTVPDGKTLTNNGTVTVEEGGTLTNNGSLDCNHHTGGTATCTEKAKCDLCGAEYGDFLPHSLTKTEAKAPTCTVVGNEAYWTCGNCGKYFSDGNGNTEIIKDSWIISAINHDWNDAVYTWSDDGSTCTATRTCKNDSAHTEKATATVTGAQTKAPTCTQMGETTYTAAFEASWAMTQTKVLADIPAIGHSYGEPVWSWSEDGKTCKVTFTCEKDETHKETPVVKVTSAVKKPATCTETGVTTYTATVEFNGQTHKDTKDVADIPATGHSYGKPVWNWSEDGKTCTVTFTCEKDENHKESPKVDVTSAVKKPATCTETGVTTYTATVEFNGQTYTDTKDVADLPATGHSYGKPVWNWSEDGKTCTVTFTCEKDENHKESPKVDVTSAVKKPATCTETGVTTYTATVEFNGQTYTDTKDVADLPATGHSYGKPVWNWSEDGKTCTVTFTCEKDENHKESPKVDVTSAIKKPATCTETGVTTYTATVEFNGQTYTDTKDVADLPATGHSYDNGKCTVCGAIASDFKVIITAGTNGSWQKGTKDGLTFTSNAAYKHFQKVQVDGKDLDASNYTVKEGSTIVTLKTSYLETLSVGKHTLAIVSETGTATTEFTIKAAASANDRNPANPNGEATESVQTGDNTNIMLWIVMLFVSASILGIAVYEKRKKHMEN